MLRPARFESFARLAPLALGSLLFGCTCGGSGDGSGDPDLVADGAGDAGAGGGDQGFDTTFTRDVDTDTADLVDTCGVPEARRIGNARQPEGFCSYVWAADLSQPRGMTNLDDGSVLVVERGRGQVTMLWDDDGDGVSGDGERAVMATQGGLNHGVAAADGFLYASTATTVYRWTFPEGARAALGGQATFVDGIPGGGHATRTLVVRDGWLYVSVGSASNVDADSSRSRIVRYRLADFDGTPFTFAEGEVFADGLRNEVGLAFDDQGRLWGVENGVDNLFRSDLGGDIHENNPAEEVNLFAEPGRFYGYPYCWSEYDLPGDFGAGPGTQYVHSSFDGRPPYSDEWCQDPDNVVPPAFSLQGHSAPLGLAFYDGASFPAEAVGDAFIGFHGSWNRSVETGYSVVRLVFDGGTPRAVESFFEFDGPNARGGEWPHRPVDVVVGASGQLLVTSDTSGVVIGIGYAP
jgi:glucose/arabinose dehydrogenase